jgi:hypothetical protein
MVEDISLASSEHISFHVQISKLDMLDFLLEQ